MYEQGFKNQAVKEVKNGSTNAAVCKKFNIATSTLRLWITEYDGKMHEMMNNVEEKPQPAAIKAQPTGIKLKSIRAVISGAVVTLRRNDVIKLLELFATFK